MPVLWYEAPIVRIKTEAPNVRRFWLEVPSEQPFVFKAGQFVVMDLPIGEKRLQRWRSYSIANAPSDPDARRNLLEFCIVRSAEGLGTQYLFDTADIGTLIRFKGPEGNFCLPDVLDKDCVFLCTGTGLAPFRSMLRDLHNTGRPHRALHLIFGTRFESGILYRAELEALAREWPGFRYDIALSRQPDWAGHKGYLHDIYLQQYAVPRPDLQFYICGWSNMIDEAVAHLLLDLGYGREQVLYELYG